MRILSLVLAVCLVLAPALWVGASECDLDLYDVPFYSATYAATPDTDWIPAGLIRYFGPYADDSNRWIPASLALIGQ